jgi:hypothetical protein
VTVVSFVNMTPPARFDAVPWTDAQIEESASEDGTFTTIDTVALSPVDVNPAAPSARSFTTILGTGDDLWYRVRFVDASSGFSEPSLPFLNSPLESVSAPYATVAQLAALLKRDATTYAAEMTSVLTAAAEEIDAELGRTTPFDDPAPALVVQVNLERAVEHWHARPVGFGVIGLDTEAPCPVGARYVGQARAQAGAAQRNMGACLSGGLRAIMDELADVLDGRTSSVTRHSSRRKVQPEPIRSLNRPVPWRPFQ